MTARKIPVTVVSGFLGSGKTTFLNRLLASQPDDVSDAESAARIVVLVNELGTVGLEHAMVRHVDDSVVLLDSGCICCTVRGQLVDTLRNLFLAALHKKIPVFSRVIIETTGIADPAPISYTLRYERFLSDRYVYDGCISLVDAVLGVQQLQHERVAVQQAVLADVLVISKTDVAPPGALEPLQQALRHVNPDAVQYLAQDAPPLRQLLQAHSLRANVAGTGSRFFSWTGGKPRHPASVHGDVQVLTMSWHTPIERPAFIKAMSALHEDGRIELLRTKGVLWLLGDDQASVFHGVHRQLYPLAPIENSTPAADRKSVLVLIFRHPGLAELERMLMQLLPGGQRVPMSPGGNFVQ